MPRQTDLSGSFNISVPVPSELYPFREEIYDYKAFFDRQNPAFGKMNKKTVTHILIFSCIAKDISD